VLKVYFFGSQNNGCGFYRIWQPAAALERLGLAEVRREPDQPGDITANRARDIFDWADVVVCQNFSALWSACIFAAARDRCGKKLIVDLDDSIWDLHPMNITRTKEGKALSRHFSDDPHLFWRISDVSPQDWEKVQATVSDEDRQMSDKPLYKDGTILELEPGKRIFAHQISADALSSAHFLLGAADAVTTTNLLLADRIRKKSGQRNIHVLPNCHTGSDWPIKQRPPNDDGTVWIGWCGSVSHYPDFREILPVLDRLMAKYPQLRIQVMGSSFDYLFPPAKDAKMKRIGGYGGDNNDLECYEFDKSGARYPGRMEFHPPVPIRAYAKWMCDTWHADIGIAPLENHPFNAAKSELKWVEYSLLGVPTVASKVGPFKRTIRHDQDGKLCGSPKAWGYALEELIESPELRQSLAAAAHARVRTDYDADKQAHRWIQSYESVVHESDAGQPCGYRNADLCAGSGTQAAGA